MRGMYERALSEVRKVSAAKMISIIGMLLVSVGAFMPMAVIESNVGGESKYLYFNGIPLLVISVLGIVLVAMNKYQASFAAFILYVGYIAYISPVMALQGLTERSVLSDSLRIYSFIYIIFTGMSMQLLSYLFLTKRQRNILRMKHSRWLVPLFSAVFIGACAMGNFYTNKQFFNNGVQSATELKDKLVTLVDTND